MNIFRRKKVKVYALCLTDFYYKGKSYRANHDVIDTLDPLYIQQPHMFMKLEEENTNG